MINNLRKWLNNNPSVPFNFLKWLTTDFSFELLNCFTAKHDELKDGSLRSDKRDVIFAERLLVACIKLNPCIPEEVIEQQVIPKLMDHRMAIN